MKTLSSRAKIGVRSCLGVALLAVISGCGGGGSAPTTLPPAGIYFGASTHVGDGDATGFVLLDKNAKPTSVGITLSDDVLQQLPTTPTEYLVELPPQANATPFTHIGLDWNPTGHPPAGVYDKPHFDFHFYTISLSQRASITDPDPATPATSVVPADYMVSPPVVPREGSHYIDTTGPEFNGQPFTSAFVYGFYNGTLNFVEPMVTKDFIASKSSFSAAIKQPAIYQKAGYYPTSYSVRYGAVNPSQPTISLHILSLDGLVKH